MNNIKEKIGKITLCDKKIFLVIIFFTCIFYQMLYVRTVLPAQSGWWQYYGWRLNEGDSLYNDLYCYLQPFFPWLMGLLYKVFGMNYIYYTITGVILRSISVCLLYCILCRFINPFYSYLASFLGFCVNTSYLMDVAFDYNPIIMIITITTAFFVIKDFEEKNRNLKYLIIIGVLFGIHFMFKQSSGIIVPFATFCIIFIYKNKLYSLRKAINSALIIIASAVVTIVPGYIYLLVTGTINSYIKCVFSAVSSKGGFSSIINNLINNMILKTEIILGIIVFLIIYITNKLWNMDEENNVTEKFKRTRSSRKITLVLLLMAFTFVFTVRYFNNILILDDIAKSLILNVPIYEYLILFISIILITLIIILDIKFEIIDKIYSKFNQKIVRILVSVILFAILFIWTCASEAFHSILFNGFSFFAFKRSLLENVTFYIFVCIWVFYTFKLIRKTIENKELIIYIYQTIFMALYFSELLSAVLEEICILPCIALVFGLILQSKLPRVHAKNYIITSACIIFCLLCLSQKLIIPYQWHGWNEPSSKSNLEGHREPDIKELKGYILADSTCNTYDSIINLINGNTEKDDTVYMFPSIPLFNTVTERRIPVTMPINYFDVCSDEMAIQSANELRKNPPKMFIWDNLGENIWLLHESVFRNGRLSGQRKIQEFYDNYVRNNYTCIGTYNNNANGAIEVWLMND